MSAAHDWLLEVRRRLQFWYRWANGVSDLHFGGNPIAAMMKRSEGDLPGGRLDLPQYLTPELEVVEKAVARMRAHHNPERRLLIDTYLKGFYLHDLAADRRWSEKKTKEELARAESICGRFMLAVELDYPQIGLDRFGKNN